MKDELFDFCNFDFSLYLFKLFEQKKHLITYKIGNLWNFKFSGL